MAKEKTRKAPKEYMRIAVDVMKKSIEERKNNKPRMSANSFSSSRVREHYNILWH